MSNEFDFLQSPPTPTKIGSGENARSINFYPLSVNATLGVRNFGKPIASALASLLAKDSNDAGRIMETITNTKEGFIAEKTNLQAIDPEVLRFRTEENKKAIAELLDALTDPKSIKALVGLVCDSMRDEFPKGSPDYATKVDKFQAEMDVPTLVELAKGMVAANKRAFGPLIDRLSERFDPTLPPQPQEASQVSSTIPTDESGTRKPNLKSVPLAIQSPD